MDLQIINTPFSLAIHGFSGVAINKDYAGTAFKLSSKTWEMVKVNNLNNKGINVWVYEPNEMVFAGVELDNILKQDLGLEQKNIFLEKYAYYKHVGPYHLIKQAANKVQDLLKEKGFSATLPYVEVYGHWTHDEAMLETELFISLK
jgi:predicted transcriptional regulator YdeE